MPYQVNLSRPAERQLARLERPAQERIGAALDRLAANPRPHGCTKLKGLDEAYRIRVGDYRVVYSIQHRVMTVLVIRIGHRREVYR